ncbi:MAG: glycosyltransferase, partial [Planctomycetaceae bacterium]
DRIHIVPHGPSHYGPPSADQRELRQRLGWPLDKQIALFFGNIRDDKNLGLMLEALRTHRDAVHLVVAGRVAGDSHRPVAHYRELAERLGLANAVTFDERYISDAEVPDLFTACDWATLPYSRQFTSQSGVLNVAVSYQRPILISATPTFVETLQRAEIGLLTEPDDVDALRSGIGRMVAAVAAGREFAFAEYERQFGWEANVRITRNVYQSLCG